MLKRIIYITGPAGAGKTTAAKILKQGLEDRNLAFGEGILAYADPVKAVAKIAFNLPFGDLDSQEYKKLSVPGYPNMTIRDAYITVGTKLFRDQVDPEFWVKHMIQRIKSMDLVETIIIPDVRYDNEILSLMNEFPELSHYILNIRVQGEEMPDLRYLGGSEVLGWDLAYLIYKYPNVTGLSVARGDITNLRYKLLDWLDIILTQENNT